MSRCWTPERLCGVAQTPGCVEQALEKAELALKPIVSDTGPLVAYLDKADDAHEAVAAFIDDCAATLCTTSAVITESMYLLKDAAAGPRRLAEFVHEKILRPAHGFADATLILLADSLNVVEIATLDRQGFRVFRTRKGKPFRLFPADLR
jgi:uncharacterized protein